MIGLSLANPSIAAAGATAREAAAPTLSDGEVDRVAAFARLFGVVRFFYPSDAAAELDWNRYAVFGVSRVRATQDERELAQTLRELVAPLGPGIAIAPELPSPAPARAGAVPLVAWQYLGAGFSATEGPYHARRTGRTSAQDGDERDGGRSDAPFDGLVVLADDHADVDLLTGLRARVPLALAESDARTLAARTASLERLEKALARVELAGNPPKLDVRLADQLVAWNVFRHFYPYWPEVGADWEAALPALIRSAAAAASRGAHERTLRALVHQASDGHGSVLDRSRAPETGTLPLRLAPVEGQVVVAATADPAVPLGAVVLEIDGRAAQASLAELLELWSGSTQWRHERACGELARGQPSTSVRLKIEDGKGTRLVTVRRVQASPGWAQRLAVEEVTSGLWYVDLTRARMADVKRVLPRLASAGGVVLDVRGYPTDAGAGLLPHLIATAETDRWMHVPRITGPFTRIADWRSFGWDLMPATPRIAGRRVWLTDARAISYAESVMGYVADQGLGTIVGSPTAGTNGNVASFDLPGGFRVRFTAMRVTRHDGHSRFHLAGVAPHVRVEPTIAGLRAGRDEVLLRGLEIASAP